MTISTRTGLRGGGCGEGARVRHASCNRRRGNRHTRPRRAVDAIAILPFGVTGGTVVIRAIHVRVARQCLLSPDTKFTNTRLTAPLHP